MPFMQIFPDIDLSQTEMDIIHGHLCDPVMQKYFHKLAYDIAKFTATATVQPGETLEEFVRKLERAHGQMEFAETLLSVNRSDSSQSTGA